MAFKYPPELARNYLDKHPDASYKDFIKDTGSKMGSRNFSYIKKKYPLEKARKNGSNNKQKDLEKRSYIRKKSFLKVYSRIWSRSTEKMSEETKEALKDLVFELNRSGRTFWEIIELVNPPEIEIREITK